MGIIDGSRVPSGVSRIPWSFGLLAMGAGSASVSGSGLFKFRQVVVSEFQSSIGEGMGDMMGCSSC